MEMDIQAEKSRLMALLENTTNESIIADLRNVFERLYSHPYSEKELEKMIGESEEDIAKGDVYTTDELKAEIKNWRKK